MQAGTPSPETVIDLETYPIHEPDNPRCKELLDYCQSELRADGCCSVENFFHPEAVADIAAMCRALLPGVYHPTDDVSPYGGEDDPSLPTDHPRRKRYKRGGGFICADTYDANSALWTFFNWPATTRFMMAAFEKAPLYQYADPMASMATNVMWKGDEFPWHFDTNELTVSVMVQAPESGGVFEYVPDIRTPDTENYERVKRIFDGDRGGVKSIALKPGDMQLFRGRYTLHRVTAVEGDVPRIVALPSWSSQPNQVGVVERMMKSYGRALPIHYERAGIAPDQLAQ